RRGGVLMARQPEPARGPQRHRPRLPGSRQILRGLAFGAFGAGLRFRGGHLLPALLSLQLCGGTATLFAQPTTFRGRGDQNGGVQALLLAHSPHPRPRVTPPATGAPAGSMRVISSAARAAPASRPLASSRAVPA